MLGVPSMAQNTKGDRPAGTNRETRFKTPKKNKQKRKPSKAIGGTRPATGKRVKEKADRPVNRASAPRTGERRGKPVRPLFSRSKPQNKQKAWRGDITGRRIRSGSSANTARNVYPQPGNLNYSSRELKRHSRANANPMVRRVQRMQTQQERPKVQKRRIVPPSASGRTRKVYSQKSFYVNKKSHKPSSYQTEAGRFALKNLKRYPGPDKPRVKNRKVVPRSSSSAFIARRSTNTWAHFPRPKRKQEKAFTKDLAGKRLRTKNFETQRPVLANPTLNYKKRIATGERPYKGRAMGDYASRTKRGQRAWKGDVAHRAIRGGKPPGGRDRAFLGFLKDGGARSATRSGEARAGVHPIPVRPPGIGANRMGKYQGNIKGAQRRGFGDQGEGYTGNIKRGRPLKGGGSVSGKIWNNQGRAVQGRAPGSGAERMGAYQGNIRAGKRGFNDQGEEYSGNIKTNRRRGFNNQGEEYSGNIKTNRRRGLNDQGEEYSGNIRVDERPGFMDQGEEYTGNIKARRPQKGGGSRSGKHWNNKNTPIQGRMPDRGSNRVATYQGNIRGRKVFNDQGEEYSGNIKTRRPEKGGGSVSGKLWNNKETPIEGRGYSSQATRVSRFSGNIKAKRPEKGGGSVSGKLWNNRESPIAVRVPKNDQGGEFSGSIKLSRKNYGKNPSSADAAQPGRKPSESFNQAGRSSRGIRRTWDYIKNPSSSDESQRVREPGKAFARSADFQGNIKMKKFELFNNKRDLHPDARFVKLNKNNVAEEKDMLTNFKLWWARLFKKNETQPEHLKAKERKPRYDKGESGLWYE